MAANKNNTKRRYERIWMKWVWDWVKRKKVNKVKKSPESSSPSSSTAGQMQKNDNFLWHETLYSSSVLLIPLAGVGRGWQGKSPGDSLNVNFERLCTRINFTITIESITDSGNDCCVPHLQEDMKKKMRRNDVKGGLFASSNSGGVFISKSNFIVTLPDSWLLC